MSLLINILIATVIGFLPGLLFFQWLASPMGPGLSVFSPLFARIFLTVSQFIRGKGVLVRRGNGRYEMGTYIPEENAVQLTDKKLPLDADELEWRIFGKKPFAITWEPGTELHQLIAHDEPLSADGGEYEINMGAAHRHFRGANDSEAINRTEEHAKAKYGGGSDGLSDRLMVFLIIIMLLLGTLTGFVMG